MFTVYILQSSKTQKYYVGQTDCLERRLQQHNSGYSKSTKHGIPWELKYYQEFPTRSEAYLFEQRLKKSKSSKYLEEFINGRASR